MTRDVRIPLWIFLSKKNTTYPYNNISRRESNLCTVFIHKNKIWQILRLFRLVMHYCLYSWILIFYLIEICGNANWNKISCTVSLNPQHCFSSLPILWNWLLPFFISISLFFRLSDYVQWFHGVTASVINNRFRVAVFQLWDE